MMQLINFPSSIRFDFFIQDCINCFLALFKTLSVQSLLYQKLSELCFLFCLQKLADLSSSPSARLIDGILLTKFDTIDDKVVTTQTARSVEIFFCLIVLSCSHGLQLLIDVIVCNLFML